MKKKRSILKLNKDVISQLTKSQISGGTGVTQMEGTSCQCPSVQTSCIINCTGGGPSQGPGCYKTSEPPHCI